CQHYYSMPSSF
nr:immunoglobulin light chain junction region [Macaca mulatta]MPN94885.1 immunoglobulin light chain junction region [Macaca mulatta]MPN96999.1 immunoglobulin light chain junction region [Macaca mulatta]MPN98257.1 immunoglobulin light chain junction region [Macaca mulatta]MPO00726.1 immunoglobulin light chain junction region [Macaca mulatta]